VRLAAILAGAALAVFATVVIALRYVVFPQIDDYRDDIAASVSRAAGVEVTLEDVDAAWQGLRPQLTLTGVRVADRRGRPVLALERVEITLSWWTLLAGELRFQDVDVFSPELRLRRARDGLIYLADKPLNAATAGDEGRLMEWLLAQPNLHVRNANLLWRDELSGAPEVELTQVQITVRKSGERHLAALNARPPPDVSGKVDIRADVLLARSGQDWTASGTVYAESGQADVAKIRSYLPLPETLRAANGGFRVWLDIGPGRLDSVTADLDLRRVRAQLAADALPLELETFSGRVFYERREGGFSAGTRGLKFRTTTGIAAEAGEYAIALTSEPGKPAHGEVRANGIDLKIAAALLDYLPVPRATKEQVLLFAPRGRLVESSLVWTGESPAQATAFRVQARFTELALNAAQGYPGATGLTGALSGDERGGTLQLDSKGVTLEALSLFQGALALDELQARASWRRAGRDLEVKIDEARLANADAELTVAGLWRSLPESPDHSPGWVDLAGRIERARVAGVATYLPNAIAETRAYLSRAVLAGEASKARFELKGDLWHFPFRDGTRGRFFVEGAITGGRLQYHPAWPTVEAIRGDLRFENARMEIHADDALIYGSHLRRAKAVVADLGANPPVLVLEGEVSTSGLDATRFLRETPLAEGPGAFAKVVAVDGAANLKLRLGYPLWGTDPVRVNGEYSFDGGTASVGRSLVLSSIKGTLGFTEKAVRSSEITGSMFGQPAVLRIGSQPDGTVLTQLEGGLGAKAIGALIPAAFARRMAGGTDWRARVASGASGTELRVESGLKGLAIGLPEPFAKRAEESRTLAVTIRRLGADDEETIAILEGGIHARITRRGEGEAERWGAALRFGGPVTDEPVQDGLWLYGDLARFDLDAWREALAAPAGPVVTAVEAPLELRGLDLRFSRLRYTGREFQLLSARLRKEGGEWRGSLASPIVAGEIAFNPAGRGRIAARLSRFTLLAETGAAEGPEPAPAAKDEELPDLDIVADRFEFHNRWLGRLELAARTQGEEWRIDRLDITNDHARLASSGAFRHTAAGPISQMDVKLSTSNISALLGQFGYGAYVSRGEAKLAGQLVWPGYPYEFALPVLSGHFKLEASKGQFARIEPGAGKLLGLLSLQSIPRRVTLDFRDVFSEGFAFDRIAGEVKLARGILLTSDFEIDGPSAFVSMAGEVSMPLETQNLTLRVVPEVGEGVAIAATVLGTPVAGLTTLILQKLLRNPLGKAVSYEYFVTGSWDNPTVTRLAAPPAAKESAKAAAAEAPTRPQ
jgi:uncharacterized protein (TIGR02099 family)